MGFRVWDLGFSCLQFGVQALGFRVWGLWFTVLGLGFRDWYLGLGF